MKANLHKSYLSLPPREQEIIANLFQKEHRQALDAQEVQLFVQYTKLACILLHDYFKMDESELLTFIGDFKAIRRKYRNVNTADKLDAVLDEELSKIFPSGFPAEYVEDLQRGR